MKKLFIALMIIISSITATANTDVNSSELVAPTGTSCSQHFLNVFGIRAGTSAAIAGAGVVAATVTFPAMAYLWPIPTTLFGISAGYMAISTVRPVNMYKLMKQAESCSGAKIQRLYKRYRRHVESPMNFQSFCTVIHEADLSGELCSHATTIPLKSTILDWIELRSKK